MKLIHQIGLALLVCQVWSTPQRLSPYQFGQCYLVINELYIGNPITEFVELAKICLSGTSNSFNSLRGFVLSVLTFGEDKNITFFYDMSDNKLQKRKPDFEAFVLGGDGVAEANKNFRDALAVVSADGSALPNSYINTHVLLLLFIPARAPRSVLSQLTLSPTADGALPKSVTNDFLPTLSQYVQDAVVFGAECTETESCDQVKTLIPEYTDPTTYTLSYPARDMELDSLSRCSLEPLPVHPEYYAHCKRSPGAPNNCEDANTNAVTTAPAGCVLPYKFNRLHLQHLAQQMIVNAVTFFKYYEDTEPPVKGKPDQVVGKILNIQSRTIKKVVAQHSSNAVLKTPSSAHGLHCKTIQLFDNFNKDLIRNIVMGMYKQNIAPFLKDVYHKFILAVENCEHIVSEVRFEDALPAEVIQETTADISQTPELQQEEVAACTTEAVAEKEVTVTKIPSRKDALINYATGLRVGPAKAKRRKTSKSNAANIISISTFRRIMIGLGFVYGKINTRLAVVQRPDVVNLRGRYLRRLRENKASAIPKPLIYTDETWADANGKFTKAWVPRRITGYSDYELFSYSKTKIGRAPRLIIVGAASDKQGVLHEVTKVYKVKKSDASGDYHENINRIVYMKWLNELLDYLDRIDPGVSYIIIIDNAPYHTSSIAPKSSDTKQVMYDWLLKEKEKDDTISLLPIKKMLKVDLWDTVKKRKSGTEYYEVDILIRSRGHEVLRLPPYNCDLNAIELLWSHIKRTIKLENTQQDINVVKTIAERILTNYPMDVWKRMVDHVMERGNIYWEEDHHSENVRSDLKILITDDPEDEDDEEFEGIPRNQFPRQIDVDSMEDTSWLMSLLREVEVVEGEEEINESNEKPCEAQPESSQSSSRISQAEAPAMTTTPKRKSNKRQSGQKRKLNI